MLQDMDHSLQRWSLPEVLLKSTWSNLILFEFEPSTLIIVIRGEVVDFIFRRSLALSKGLVIVLVLLHNP